jgi:hypothetical protein
MAKPHILLSRETYNNLLKKSNTLTRISDSTSAKSEFDDRPIETASPSEKQTISNDVDIANKHNRSLLTQADRNSLLSLQTAILQGVRSTGIIGKLMVLWMFVKDQFEKGALLWNDNGELLDDDEHALVRSDIPTLIRHIVLRTDSTKKPVGFEHFINKLKELNVPQRLLVLTQKGSGKQTQTVVNKNKQFYLKRKANAGIPGVKKLKVLEKY